MSRIRIVKKNDEYTSEYQVGDLFEITGTWYGGVHIMGKSGAPVSLDKEEYVELDTEPASSSKVTPMRHPASRKGGNMEVCVVKPSSVDDSREITETLLSGRTVILNLEGMDLELAQRIIDFISGATFAINGNLQKISNYIFLVTPTNVDISGDLQDLLGGSMETPSVKGRY